MFLFFALGLVIKIGTSDTDWFEIRFDDKCGDSKTCTFPLFVKSKMKGPLYMYLTYKDFFVQHRNSLKSVSQSQLSDLGPSTSTLQSSCAGAYTNREAGHDFSVTGVRLNPDEPANPCGVLASLFPTGTLIVTPR